MEKLELFSTRYLPLVITSNCWVITTPSAAWLNVFWFTAEDELNPCRERSKREPPENLHQLLFATIRQKSPILAVFLKYFHYVPSSTTTKLRNDVPLKDKR